MLRFHLGDRIRLNSQLVNILQAYGVGSNGMNKELELSASLDLSGGSINTRPQAGCSPGGIF